MARATIKLVSSVGAGEFYFAKDPAGLARDLLSKGGYEAAADIFVTQEGEEAAEEMFELTNNPSRQGERLELYGRGRSVSVGDIVAVDGINYLCLPTGWVYL